ncbi:hypothetical protein A7K94_0201055 [Modestobacter sp. VKM Ac-2676]|nr:hypothetical protein A7K94_0201055 [Modestobacter sp. VKM Ac-2676]
METPGRVHRSQGGAPFVGELDVRSLVSRDRSALENWTDTSNDLSRTLGTSGLPVSPLAIGTMTFDDGTWGSTPELSHQILDRYLDPGGNLLDAANQYNGGPSEETLGAWFLRNPSRRDRVVPCWHEVRRQPAPGRFHRRRCRPGGRLHAVARIADAAGDGPRPHGALPMAGHRATSADGDLKAPGAPPASSPASSCARRPPSALIRLPRSAPRHVRRRPRSSTAGRMGLRHE